MNISFTAKPAPPKWACQKIKRVISKSQIPDDKTNNTVITTRTPLDFEVVELKDGASYEMHLKK